MRSAPAPERTPPAATTGLAEVLAAHETWGWDGATGYRCCCGQKLAEESWRNAEPLYRAHVASVTTWTVTTTRPLNEGDIPDHPAPAPRDVRGAGGREGL